MTKMKTNAAVISSRDIAFINALLAAEILTSMKPIIQRRMPEGKRAGNQKAADLLSHLGATPVLNLGYLAQKLFIVAGRMQARKRKVATYSESSYCKKS